MGLTGFDQKVRQAVLKDRHLPALEECESGAVGLTEANVMPKVSQSGCRHKAYVSSADNRYFHDSSPAMTAPLSAS
jgi:hypothetical protein